VKKKAVKSLSQKLRRAGRVQHELRKRLFYLKTLYDVSREIGGHIDSQQIAGTLLMMVMGVFGAVRGLIIIVDVERRTILATSRRGVDAVAAEQLREAAEAGELASLRGLAGVRAVRARSGAESPVLRLVASLGIERWFSFDINEQCVAGIGLGEKLSGESYSRDEEELLTTLCNQARVAVRNAMAHEEVVRYAAELERSLRRIQMLENIKSNLAKFVPATVQALIEESPEAPLLEKREADVSVLFADITGYTRLSVDMELHEVNKLVERYFGAFLDEIIRCGGDVNETVGDGLMVIFQDPDTGRHAAAAVEAALGIQRRTREINEELSGHSDPIVMRVGVNSGVASVGATKIEGLAGTRWTYTASGLTTNVAARLAALSEGGDVILSEETLRRVGPGLAAEDRGEHTLKNVPQPMRVYRMEISGDMAATALPAGATGPSASDPRRTGTGSSARC
jgi:class 3 adenylate cyclase